MEKVGFSPIFFNEKVTPQSNSENTPHNVQQDFSTFLSKAIDEVNEAELAADKATAQLVNNETTNLHDVMIAAEKASVTMQVTLEVRNKVIEAYQEVMRMPL